MNACLGAEEKGNRYEGKQGPEPAGLFVSAKLSATGFCAEFRKGRLAGGAYAARADVQSVFGYFCYWIRGRYV